ncbi:MAG: hypothetical protein AABY78_02090 [Nitrospirota bacterium]
MGSKRINPPRRKTKELVRSDYRKGLATKQVSSTAETEIPIIEALDGTDKIPPIEQAPLQLTKEPVKEGQKLTKTHYIIGIVGGIIGILIFVGVIVSNYTSLKEGLNHTNSNLRELKQSINERINRLEERIDKYISKEKSK